MNHKFCEIPQYMIYWFNLNINYIFNEQEYYLTSLIIFIYIHQFKYKHTQTILSNIFRNGNHSLPRPSSLRSRGESSRGVGELDASLYCCSICRRVRLILSDYLQVATFRSRAGIRSFTEIVNIAGAIDWLARDAIGVAIGVITATVAMVVGVARGIVADGDGVGNGLESGVCNLRYGEAGNWVTILSGVSCNSGS